MSLPASPLLARAAYDLIVRLHRPEPDEWRDWFAHPPEISRRLRSHPLLFARFGADRGPDPPLLSRLASLVRRRLSPRPVKSRSRSPLPTRT